MASANLDENSDNISKGSSTELIEINDRVATYIQEIEILVDKLALPLNQDSIRNICAGLKENMELLREAIGQPTRAKSITEFTPQQTINSQKVASQNPNELASQTEQENELQKSIREMESLMVKLGAVAFVEDIHINNSTDLGEQIQIVKSMSCKLHEAFEELSTSKERLQEEVESLRKKIESPGEWLLELQEALSALEKEIKFVNVTVKENIFHFMPVIFVADNIENKLQNSDEGNVNLFERDDFYFTPMGHRFSCNIQYMKKSYNVFWESQMNKIILVTITVQKCSLDNYLKWPFKQRIKLTLVNQVNSDFSIVRNIDPLLDFSFCSQSCQFSFDDSEIMPDGRYFSDFLRNNSLVFVIETEL